MCKTTLVGKRWIYTACFLHSPYCWVHLVRWWVDRCSWSCGGPVVHNILAYMCNRTSIHKYTYIYFFYYYYFFFPPVTRCMYSRKIWLSDTVPFCSNLAGNYVQPWLRVGYIASAFVSKPVLYYCHRNRKASWLVNEGSLARLMGFCAKSSLLGHVISMSSVTVIIRAERSSSRAVSLSSGVKRPGTWSCTG